MEHLSEGDCPKVVISRSFIDGLWRSARVLPHVMGPERGQRNGLQKLRPLLRPAEK